MIGGVRALAAGVAAALLLASAARAADGAKETAPPAAERSPSASSERPRVAAGVLVRATSRRAQKRAASPRHERAAAPAAGDAVIDSIEIDWNGSGATP